MLVPSSEAPVAGDLKMASWTVPVMALLALSAVLVRASLALPAVPVGALLRLLAMLVRAPSMAVWLAVMLDLRLLPCATGGERKSAVAINASSLVASVRQSPPNPSWVRSSGAPAAPCGSWATAVTGMSLDVGRQ